MQFQKKLEEVQGTLIEQRLDGWLLFDFHRSNSLACKFLEIPSEIMATRRFFYWIPQKGSPVKIVSLIEPCILDHLPGVKWLYRGWQELEGLLFSIASKKEKIAMEYSPCNALPSVSTVDAGTVEWVRQTGVQVVSSANILQRYTSQWSSDQFKSHLAAARVLEQIVERTWTFIERSLHLLIPINEYQVHQFMLQLMHEEGCETVGGPICAVNVHSSDPHYYPDPQQAFSIRAGDLILLDLWCKQKAPHAVYADITRVGVASVRPTHKQQEIFNIVKDARDQATLFIKEHYEDHRLVQGWQVDQRCRDVIQKAGYGEYFLHRTGHNIGEDVHGPGANLDNLETHDYRVLLPATCFSIEPGIYLPQQFGIRLEYDIFLDPMGVMRITGGVQEEFMHFVKEVGNESGCPSA